MRIRLFLTYLCPLYGRAQRSRRAAGCNSLSKDVNCGSPYHAAAIEGGRGGGGVIPFLLFRTMKRRPLRRGCLPGVQAGAMLVRAYCGRLSKVGWALCVLRRNGGNAFVYFSWDMTCLHIDARVFFCAESTRCHCKCMVIEIPLRNIMRCVSLFLLPRQPRLGRGQAKMTPEAAGDFWDRPVLCPATSGSTRVLPRARAREAQGIRGSEHPDAAESWLRKPPRNCRRSS